MDRVVRAAASVNVSWWRAAAELEGAVAEAIRPRDQRLPTAAAAHLVDRVAVEQRPVRRLVGAQSAADLDYDGALIAVADLVLLA